MSLRRSLAAAVAVATVSLASAAWSSPWALKPGEFYSELSGQFYSARSFYRDNDAVRSTLHGTLEQRTVRSHNELGWKKRASVWFDVPFVSRTAAGNGGGSVTSTGLGDLDFGIRYGMHVGHAPLALELGWTAPLGANRRLFPGTSGSGGTDGTRYGAMANGPVRDANAFFDTGLQSLSAALELGGTAGKRAFWTVGGGYRTSYLGIGARDTLDRYADFATATGSLGFWVGGRLLVTGSIAGEWQVAQGDSYDRIADTITRRNAELKSETRRAGSRFTYRVDDRMDVFAGSWHTPSGRNVLHTDQFYAGIAWKQTGLDRLAGALGGTKAH